jgi:hypothetical protein
MQEREREKGVPGRLAREKNRGELRRDGVHDVAPVNSTPHLLSDLSDLIRSGEVAGEGTSSSEREPKAERYLDGEGDEDGGESGTGDRERVLPRADPVVGGFRGELTATEVATPAVAYEGV